MSERMTPMPFSQLMGWIFAEYEKTGGVFGVTAPYLCKDTEKALPLFNEKLETPFGPAAGPNTQLAQNIVAAYFAGCRFFELKTVQKMDGEELAACIGRPCILADDEGYNCEWSTELTVPQAMEEYIKAWIAIKIISKVWKLGDPNGFMFNMSVGYDLAGIKTPKLDAFIEGLKDASKTEIWASCMADIEKFGSCQAEYAKPISPNICTGVTVSTLHGCPPQEIEAIASYLISEKRLNTFVKCNPTILGYEFCRATLDKMGYDYISFDEHHFNEDLQYEDAVPMFTRLSELASSYGLEFGLKLSNTFPVEVKQQELPSSEMYMSGKALYPLTLEMAARISKQFKGALRLSYSGGADYFNIKELFLAGIWPITVATTILKPGGYNRCRQIAELFEGCPYAPFAGVDYHRVAELAHAAQEEPRHLKAVKPLPSRKLNEHVPLIDCFTAPCKGGCPIQQDIPEYIELVGKGEYLAALKLITEKNPLPFITGTICAHRCMDKCTRNFYDDPVYIRACKLEAAEHAYPELLAGIQPPSQDGPKVAIVGAGPAGIAAAFFAARGGCRVTVFEKHERAGGLVENVIPDFRISYSAIEKDVMLAEAYGAEFIFGAPAPDAEALKNQDYDYILLAVGAERRGKLELPGNVMNVIDFLHAAKYDPASIKAGRHIAVVGGGNSAMDAARAAMRLQGVKKVSLVYRRTKKYMPADAEELELAIADGVEFAELLSPVKQESGKLVCKKMKLGEPDASGRRSPVDTGELCEVAADLVVAAVGEHPDPAAFLPYGVTLSEKEKALPRYGNVFVAGDALRGPATVVEAIADAAAFAGAILGERSYAIPENAYPSAAEALAKKGTLAPQQHCDAERCLSCNTVCECCVSVCPNRANVSILSGGKRQILHVDYLCNECGNCATFCPYDSAPYRDKFTYFANLTDFTDSENDGFMLLEGDLRVRVRLNGSEEDYELSSDNALDKELECLILSVIRDYPYILGR